MPESPIFHLKRYADVRAALLDIRMDIHKPVAMPEEEEQSRAAADPSRKARSRRIGFLSTILARHLSSASLAPLAAQVSTLANELLAQGHQRGGMDLIADLAYPLPLMVMQDILGLPRAEIDHLQPLFTTITAGHDIDSSDAQRQAARFALLSMSHWLTPQLKASDSPLVTAIRTVAEEADMEQMVPYWCSMLLFAGSTTTRDFIGNTLARLIEHPGEAEQLRREPTILDSAIEELLRVEGPVKSVGRVVREEMAIDSKTLPCGTIVQLHLHAANRDPSIFAEPERVDFTRHPNPHLAFGLGATRCLGANLARFEVRTVLTTVLPLLPHMRLAATPEWSTSNVLRERTRLAVAFN